MPASAGIRRRGLLAAWAGLGGLAGCQPGSRAPSASVGQAGLPPGGWLGASAGRGHLLRDGPSAATSPPVARRCAVAIVGAGVAGLAAARALVQAGVDDLRCFELEDQAGGNARGHQMGGMACPLGAHYLPMPTRPAHEVSDFLHELGLLQQVLGRTVPDERHLCHSPQERLWLNGPWVEGLLPPAQAGSARLRHYQGFAAQVRQAHALGFAIPTRRAAWGPAHAALDGQTFAQWLDQQALTDPGLRWYLDYACRDDYGAGAATVSAWAGLHYFASRHGFHAPGEEGAEREAVFTWPEGNAWLTRRLAAPLGDRLQPATVVLQVQAQRHGVQIDTLRLPGGQRERWTAEHAVLAVPLHVAARLLDSPPEAQRQAVARLPQAPWLVANLQLGAPLTDKPGAAPAWDNVLLPAGLADDSASEALAHPTPAAGPVRAPAPTTTPALTPAPTPALGYVDALHQSLRPVPGPTVITAYWALGDGDAAQRRQQRQALIDQPWQHWAGRVVGDLARAHPDLPGKTQQIGLMRYGHAMAIPVPGLRGDAALQALAEGHAAGPGPRLHWAHSDLAGYSVFEEAFTAGHTAGATVAATLRGAPAPRRKA